ncbi:hypothetical protein H9P43_007234 [Blastocladiella emersonii ATCC 22665]|nr:hypothetical protein H9P43_007234 [Blastocladiella emersonii ATCC 22665]
MDIDVCLRSPVYSQIHLLVTAFFDINCSNVAAVILEETHRRAPALLLLECNNWLVRHPPPDGWPMGTRVRFPQPISLFDYLGFISLFNWSSRAFALLRKPQFRIYFAPTALNPDPARWMLPLGTASAAHVWGMFRFGTALQRRLGTITPTEHFVVPSWLPVIVLQNAATRDAALELISNSCTAAVYLSAIVTAQCKLGCLPGCIDAPPNTNICGACYITLQPAWFATIQDLLSLLDAPVRQMHPTARRALGLFLTWSFHPARTWLNPHATCTATHPRVEFSTRKLVRLLASIDAAALLNAVPATRWVQDGFWYEVPDDALDGARDAAWFARMAAPMIAKGADEELAQLTRTAPRTTASSEYAKEAARLAFDMRKKGTKYWACATGRYQC